MRHPRPLSLLVVAVGLSAAPPLLAEDDAHPTTTARDSLLDDLLEQAGQMARSGNYPEAVRRYLRVEAELAERRKKDPHDRPTTEVGPGIDRGVGLYLRDRIRALPPDALRLYRLTIDPRAKSALADALASRVPERIEAVIARYPLSTEVARALPALAALALERGELARAIRAYRRLEQQATEPRLKRKAALLRTYAAILRRDAAQAQAGLAAYVKLGGDSAAPRAFGTQRASLADLVARVDGATTDPAGPLPASFDPGGLQRRMALAYPELPPDLAQRVDRPFAYQEAVYDPRDRLLFVADAKTIRAVPVGPRARGGWVYSRLDPQAEPSRLEVVALRPALGPGRVFVTLHRNRPAKLVPGKEADKLDVRRRKDWRVVAVDRRRGRLIWDAAAAPAFERFARGAEWISPPCYHEGAVYVVALERKTDLRATLLRLDAASGQLLSRTFLASRPAYDYLGLGAPPPAPAVSRLGHIVVATGVGAVAAVEPTQGEPVWITRYPIVPQASEPAIVDARRRFRPHPPLAQRDPIVVAPVDGAQALALDPRSGRIRWRVPRRRARLCVEGPEGEVLLLGERLVSLERATGRITCEGPRFDDPVVAPPAVLGQELIAPTQKALLRVDLKTGEVRSRLRFHDPEREVGPALAIGAQGVVTVAPTRVNVYQDLAAAQQAIAKQTVPGPQRNLALGLLHARRGELVPAVKALRRALRTRGLSAREALRVRTAGVDLLRREALRRHAQGRAKGFRIASEHAFGFLGPIGTQPNQEIPRDERDLLLAATPLLRLYADTLASSPDAADWKKAAGAYQRLLWSPPGTVVPIQRGGVQVDARAYARERLVELVAARGRAVYEPYEQKAQAEYRLAKEPLSKTGLRNVARSYPASSVAASARWDLARLFDGQGLRTRAAIELARFVRDHPDDARLPEALARLAQTHALLRQPADARRWLDRLAALKLGADAKVQGADDAPAQPVATFVRRQRAKLSQGTRAAALARAAATAGLTVPLSLAFRGSTELSQLGRELIAVDRQDAADLFLLRREELLEIRRVPDGELLITLPNVPRTALRPLLLGDVLVVPYRDRLVGYDVSRPQRKQPRPAWRYTVSPTFRGVLSRRHAVHALYHGPGLALVLTGSNDVLAIDARGKKRWEAKLPNPANGGLRVEGGRVLAITSFPAQISALSLTRGKSAWSYRPPVRPGLQARIGNPTWISPERLVYVHGGKRLVTIDTSNGKEVWTSQGQNTDWVTEVHASSDGRHVVARQQSGTRYGIRTYDAKTGQELWRDDGNGAARKPKPVPGAAPASITRIVVEQGTAFTFRRTNNRTELWAQELVTGRRQWFYRLPPGSQARQLIITPSAVIVPRSGIFSSRATLVVLGRGNGRVIESHPLPGRRLLGEGAEAVGGTIVVTTEKGLLGYGPRDEETLARLTITLARKLQRAPQDADIRAQLASALSRLGRRDAAIDLLQQGLLAEGLRAVDFDTLFAHLTAISETESESTPVQLAIRSLPRPPEIDGELNDWWRPWSSVELRQPRHVIPIQQAPGSEPGRWSGKEDLSAKLYMGWDEKHFYFALDVSDMNLRPYDSESERWIGDCLLIAIDCKNDGGDVVLSDDVLLSLALTLPKKKDDENKDEEQQEGEKNKPEGKYFVHRKEDNSGAIYEVAVPWSLFVKNGARINPATGPKKGFVFGFNVVLTDDDGDRFGADDPNNKKGGPRGALKTLELTPGVLLHHQKNRLWRGYIPKRFAKITLE